VNLFGLLLKEFLMLMSMVIMVFVHFLWGRIICVWATST